MLILQNMFRPTILVGHLMDGVTSEINFITDITITLHKYPQEKYVTK